MNKNYIYIIIILILTACLTFSVKSCRDAEAESNHNLIAMVDSVDYYKGKNDELVAEKTLLTGDIDVLKTANADLYKQIESMKVKKPEQVVYVETIIENEVRDTTYVRETVDSIYNFDFSNEWRDLSGNIEIDTNNVSLNILKDYTYFNASIAIKNGRAYVTSDNPYLKVTNMDGFTLPKQKNKRLGFGPYIGLEYDFEKRKVCPSIGVSISWHLFEF